MIDAINQLQLSTVVLKNFRCFDQVTIDLDSPIVLICGSNGTGKTSLLEALHYACYLKSFRTNNARHLIALDKESFFIKLVVRDNAIDNYIDHTINIGFSDNKRLVKINNKSTVSYKDLLSHYRIISLTEDDLMLIKGEPAYRRTFLDQALLLHDASFLHIMKDYRLVVEHRSSLLQNNYVDQESYFIWSQKLWSKVSIIQEMRKSVLIGLEKKINKMLFTCFGEGIKISFSYIAKKNSHLPFDTFWLQSESLLKEELHYHRTLFGAHLDDFSISLEGKKSRSFASRGQQKMIVLLIKAAQIEHLMGQREPVIFLLDDFMTDFDAERGSALLSILFSLKCQLILTSPHQNSPLEEAMKRSDRQFKKISM